MSKSKVSISLVTLCLSAILVIATQSSSAAQKLTSVSKPSTSGIPVLHRRIQKPIPTKFKNIPFVSPNPLPKPTAIEKQRGFILFSRPITQPVYKMARPLPAEKISALTNFATLGEYEPLTFAIYPLRDMKNFRVVVSALKSADATIAKSDIDLRLATYWKMRYPRYTSAKTYRELPELLENVTVNSFTKTDCQRYWLTIHVPPKATPGLYHGSVMLFDDVAAKALKLPITFRVLDYSLLKDPAKHFTSFYPPYSHMFRAYRGATIDKAITTDLSEMLKHGFDVFPVFYLHSRAGKNGKGEFYIKPNDELMIKKAIELGFKGRVLLVDGTGWFYKKYCPDAKVTGGHGSRSQYPATGSGFYKDIATATEKFIAECKKKGWPKLRFFPFDEPRVNNAEYCAKTYAAFKAGGADTLISNDPTSSYAHFYRKHDGVDIWCSQAFAVPYEKTVADKRYTYWAYPNHNSGEIKDRVVMQKGGRMTYGYGLWRSGYKGLMPWAWRWFPGPGHIDQFDYFHYKKASGTGNRLDEKGNFIPAIAWECFREGYDDGRYLYTLQQAMTARKNSSNPECKKLIAEAQQLINNLWQSIPPRKKYLKCKFFSDDDFKTLRWKMASLTMKLLKYPAENKTVAPSVMADTKIIAEIKDDAYFIKQAIKQQAVDYYDMSAKKFSNWHPTRDRELKFSVKPDGMLLDLHIDHKIDGAHPKTNKAPIGWPYIKYDLRQDKTDLNNYDFFYCKIKFSSDRDDVANDVTKLRFVFRRQRGKGEYGPIIDLGGNENAWVTVQIPLDNPNIHDTVEILLLPFEGYYPDQTKIKFTVAEIGLVKFKAPFIKRIDCVSRLMSTNKQLKLKLAGYAFKKGQIDGVTATILLKNRMGKLVARLKRALTTNFQATLPLNTLSTGNYQLDVILHDKQGKEINRSSKTIVVIPGFIE
jgi:hypothetical protein